MGKKGHGHPCKPNHKNSSQRCTSTTITVSSRTTTTFSPTVSTLKSTQSDPKTTKQRSTTVQSEELKYTTATSAHVNVAYIAAPVAICVIALLLVISFIWWRRRKKGPSVLYQNRDPNSLIPNEVYEENGTDGNSSSNDIRQSTVKEYAEIALDQMNPDNTTCDNYQTIDMLPEDNVFAKNSYSNVTQSKAMNVNYSHIGMNQIPTNTHSDNTYAHTSSVISFGKPKMNFDEVGDETYNRLKTSTLKSKKVKDDKNTEYNHAHSGVKDPQNIQNENDNYSHLPNSKET